MTCAEFDAFAADPARFRSRFELENEKVERERDAARAARDAQEERDLALARSLLADEERAEATRRADEERRAKEARERAARAAREAEERRRAEERRQAAAEVERKKREEAANLSTISRTTKNCPGCKWPIEKNGGW